MYLLSRATLALVLIAAAAQALIGAAGSAAWAWPASCLLIAVTLIAVRAVGERRRRVS